MGNSMNFKVLHLVNSLATGGAETFVVNLVQGLREVGITVDLGVLRSTAGAPADHAKASGIKTYMIGDNRKFSGLTNGRLKKLGRQYDIVHAHLFPFIWYVPILLANVGPALVCTEHSTQNGRRSFWFLNPLERQLYRRFSAIICVSDDVRIALLKWIPIDENRLKVIPPGIPRWWGDTFSGKDTKEAVRQELQIPAEARVVVTVSRLVTEKGLELAIDALAAIDNVVFLIVGDGPLRQNLEARCRMASLPARFIGHRSDVPRWLLASDLYLATSLWEGMPVSVLEAMAMGLPVVATDVPGLRETVVSEKTGLLVQRRREDVSGAIQRLLKDPQLIAQMGDRAREVAQRFRLERVVSDHLALYERLLTRGSGQD